MDDQSDSPALTGERRDCPHLEDLPAWLQGELDRESEDFLASHVLFCETCAQERHLLAELLANLNGSDDALEALPLRRADSVPLVRKAFATAFSQKALGAPAAICLGLFLCLLTLMALKLSPTKDPDVPTVDDATLSSDALRAAHNDAIAWILRQQDADGSFAGWPLQKGTIPLPRTRLTRLALLALASASEASSGLLLAIERAVSFLETERQLPADHALDALIQELIQRRFLQEPCPSFAEALGGVSGTDEALRSIRQEWQRQLVRWQRELDWISSQSETPLTDIPTRFLSRLGSAGALQGSFNPPAIGPRAGDRFLATVLFALSCAEAARR